MATLTTHVLNIAMGTPAAGMRIELRALTQSSSVPPSTSRTNADGRCPAPLLEGAAFRTGRYSLTLPDPGLRHVPVPAVFELQRGQPGRGPSLILTSGERIP